MSQLVSLLPERVHGLYLAAHEWEQVAAILQQLIPDRNVWAFGSRATGLRLKRYSDLDLAIDGKLTWTQRAALSEAFDESPLPFKVDLVELELVEASFRERIQNDFAVVQS